MRKLKKPKYANGGEFGNVMANTGLGIGDLALSTLGMNNVIGDDAYRGQSAQGYRDVTNVGGSILKAAAPAVMNAVVPGSGVAVSAGQQLLGSTINSQISEVPPTDSLAYQQYIRAQKQQQIGNSIGGVAGMGAAMGIQAYQNSNSGSKRYGGIQYPNGGVSGAYPNAELELQENTLNPDGSTTQLDAPSHEQGGAKVNLRPGTLVFSDKLKMGKKTYAELNKANNTNKEEKILNNTKSTASAKKTAQMMAGVKQALSQRLFQAQESHKAQKLENYAKRLGVDSSQFRNGGIKQYTNGGTDPIYGPNQFSQLPQGIMSTGYNPNLFDDAMIRANGGIPINHSSMAPMAETDPSQGFMNQLGAQQYPSVQGGTRELGVMEQRRYNRDTMPNMPIPYTDDELFDNFSKTTQLPRTTPLAKPQGAPQTGANIPWNQIGKLGEQALMAGVSNLGNFYDLKRASTVDKTTYNRVSPKLLDPTQALRDNRLMSKNMGKQMVNLVNGNSSTLLGNRQALAAQTMDANARIRAQYDNQNAQIANQGQYYNAGIGDREVDANQQNQAQARNLKSNAYANIGSNIMNQYQMQQKMGNEATRDSDILAIIAKNPQMANDPELQAYLKKNKRGR